MAMRRICTPILGCKSAWLKFREDGLMSGLIDAHNVFASGPVECFD